MFETEAHPYRIGRQRGHHPQVVPVLLVRKIVGPALGFQQRIGQTAHLPREILLAITGFHRDEHGDHHARQRGMDSRIIKQGPDDESRYQIEHNAGFAHFIQEIDAYEDQDRNRKQQQIDLLAVKQRDHQNLPQVVRHGQGRQENFERNRHPIAEYRKDADGESNVRRRRDSPAGCRDGSRVERKIDQCRHHHTAQSRQHGQNRLPDGRELSDDDFAFDLETDQKEEHHHQPVIDEGLEGQAPGKHPVDQTAGTTHHQSDVDVEHPLVILRRPGKIGQQHRNGDTEEQHQSARPGSLQKTTPPQLKLIMLPDPAVHGKKPHCLFIFMFVIQNKPSSPAEFTPCRNQPLPADEVRKARPHNL